MSLVRFRPEAPLADLAHLVERDLAKVEVAGSSPVIRSIFLKEEMQISSFLIGSIAQLGEHLPYKQRVIGSSPIVSTKFGPVVQLVRTLACHARGQGFESPSGRHLCGFSSFGRASPCQGEGGGFEPRNPLQFFMVT